MRHPLHSMCGYLGAFPSKVPRLLLSKWFREGEVILDPFCGCGTTIVEAVLAGHSAIGIDLNPLAVAITEAKIQDVTLEDALFRIRQLSHDFEPDRGEQSPPDSVRAIFHDRTLDQLMYLRNALGDSPEDRFLRGAILGILHGKWRKDGTSLYLSLDMPNTFSMSPDYVRRFTAKHGLVKPAVDVFARLTERVRWLLRTGSLPQGPRAVVLRRDGANCHSALDGTIGKRRVGVITSPPYLGVLRYGAFNWIRLWFLSESASGVDRTLDTTDSLDRYLSFMVSALLSLGETLPANSTALFVIGDVVEGGQELRLAYRLWDELTGLVPFELVGIDADEFDPSGKTTRIWGEERRGRATPMDRILILRRRPRRARRRQTNAAGVSAPARLVV